MTDVCSTQVEKGGSYIHFMRLEMTPRESVRQSSRPDTVSIHTRCDPAKGKACGRKFYAYTKAGGGLPRSQDAPQGRVQVTRRMISCGMKDGHWPTIHGVSERSTASTLAGSLQFVAQQLGRGGASIPVQLLHYDPWDTILLA